MFLLPNIKSFVSFYRIINFLQNHNILQYKVQYRSVDDHVPIIIWNPWKVKFEMTFNVKKAIDRLWCLTKAAWVIHFKCPYNIQLLMIIIWDFYRQCKVNICFFSCLPNFLNYAIALMAGVSQPIIINHSKQVKANLNLWWFGNYSNKHSLYELSEVWCNCPVIEYNNLCK